MPMSIECIAYQIKEVCGWKRKDATEVVGRMIKEYEQSKWIEFNLDDSSTWPPLGDLVVTNHGVAYFTEIIKPHWRGLNKFRDSVDWSNVKITHWQALPNYQKILTTLNC